MKIQQKNRLFKVLFFFVVLGILLIPKNVSASDGTVRFKGFTKDSVTITWDPSRYLTGDFSEFYTVHSVFITDSNNSTKPDKNSVLWKSTNLSQRQVTFSKLKKGYTNFLTVWLNCTVKQSGRKEDYILGGTFVNTTLQTPKLSSFHIQNIGGQKPCVDFAMEPPKSNLKFEPFDMQIELCLKNGKKIRTTTNPYASTRIKRDTIYKYRARVFWKNISNQKTYYSAWSNWKYFDLPSMKIKATSKKGIQLTVKKVAGVKNYTVYVSKNNDSRYKKTQTIKLGSKSKYNVKISKCGKSKLKKGSVYYIKIIPNLKIGSKIIKSEASEYDIAYIPKK